MVFRLFLINEKQYCLFVMNIKVLKIHKKTKYYLRDTLFFFVLVIFIKRYFGCVKMQNISIIRFVCL